LGVGQIKLTEGRTAVDRLAVSPIEVIDHHNAASRVEQLFHGM